MSDQNNFRLSVNVMIQNTDYAAGAVSIRDEVVIKPVNFQQMAEILEAFHVLVEKYRVKP